MTKDFRITESEQSSSENPVHLEIQKQYEARLGLTHSRINFPGFWKDGCPTPLACLPGRVAHPSGQPGFQQTVLVATLPHRCSGSDGLPMHSPTLEPSMAPYCAWGKALSLAWHSQPPPSLRQHCSWSPTLKIAQTLRTA